MRFRMHMTKLNRLFLDRSEKRVIDVIQIINQSSASESPYSFAIFFLTENSLLWNYSKNTNIFKLLYPIRLFCFSEQQLYTQKTDISCQVAVATLFWAKKN